MWCAAHEPRTIQREVRSPEKHECRAGVGAPPAHVPLVLVAAALFALCGCRNEMYDQPRYEPYEASDFFDNGMSSRPLVAGTVPHYDAADRSQAASVTFNDGSDRRQARRDLPFPVDRAVLERGQERFRIFCTPCHGELGDGRGIVVQRGFNPPPSFHSDERTPEAGRPLFRRDDPRSWNHVLLRRRESRRVIAGLSRPISGPCK